MKKILCLFTIMVLFYSSIYAADTKTTALPENTLPVGTDIIMMVDDPGGTAASEKVTFTNIWAPLVLIAGTQTVTGDKTFSGATTLGKLTNIIFSDGTETVTSDTFAFTSNWTLANFNWNIAFPAASIINSTTGLLAADVVDYTNTTGSSKALTPVSGSTTAFAAGFTGANLYGGTYIVTSDTGDLVIPAMLINMNFAIITSGAIQVVADCNAADGYLLDGVTGAEGANITNLSTSGDIAYYEYYTADDWLITTNGWTAE